MLARNNRRNRFTEYRLSLTAWELIRNDPMLAVIAALDVYHGAYSRLPAEVAKGCNDAAKSAADTASTLAQTNMNNAVAQLVPSVEQAVEKAAKTAVQRIKIGTSLFTIWFGMCSLGVMFGVGWLAGAHILGAFQDKTITGETFWQYTGQDWDRDRQSRTVDSWRDRRLELQRESKYLPSRSS